MSEAPKSLAAEEAPPQPRPDPAPREAYETRLADRVAEATRRARLDRLLSNSRLFFFAAGAAVGFAAFGTRSVDPWWVALPAALFAILMIMHDRVIRARQRADRAVAFYERGLARIDDRWAGGGSFGERHRERAREHPCAEDLDLFGEGSLYELLCTARTTAGEDKLADWLLEPADPPEILERQRSVEALRCRLDLREDLALLGDDVRTRLDPGSLVAWGAAPGRPPSALPRIVAALASALSLLTAAGWIFAGWTVIPLLFALALQSGVGLAMRPRVHAVLASAEGAARDIRLLGGILARIEVEPPASPRLRALRSALETEGLPPSRRIASLERLVDLLDARRNQLFAPIGALLLWGTHVGLAIESWRVQHGPALPRWLDAVAEMEALCALSAYAFEHPDDPFPEIASDADDPVYEGTGLGHPLLPDESCVRNDVALGPVRRVYMVSGSNMSGKSTLLRTVGVNAVLALAGAPVRATRLRISPMKIAASIHVIDSLQRGTSHFYAEIQRLRQMMDLAEGERPVLFLLDEVLHGTNSHDRRIGAGGLLDGLLARRTLGLVTTHDLALARLAEDLAPRVENVHFQDHLEGGEMRFDYRLQAGVVTRSNALELMRAVGLDV